MNSSLALNKQVGRFAPSPTGVLHFGSLVTAVASYCMAKQTGGQWLVRIDDLDQPRVVAGAADAILQQLDSMGLHWDGEILYQSRRTERYREVVQQLQAYRLTYPCCCSRKQVIASAPHFGDEGPIYPRTCLGKVLTAPEVAQRLITTHDELVFHDLVQGEMRQDIAAEVGDFILQRRDGVFAYQLAVVVDDHDSGVTQIVRGRDLLASTARQIYLSRLLAYAVPVYAHLPLALTHAGEKISKRHHQIDMRGMDTGRLVYQALVFLGQNPPAEMFGEQAQVLLRWGCENFSIAAVPAQDGCVELADGCS
ncbi:MAG: tRNA glutamyl-Q(34) synthetase GluQRS [Desulfuromonas sp.]|nr:tRNA glutamyl-Q(34) synthetase GluQRS [Desulfuromonas sp.]